jgi:hypothetical protein
MSSPYEGLQQFVTQLPEFVQPLIIAGLGMIPYVEGEGSAALGILVGIDPVVAAVAGAAGNILSVVLVVLFGARVRERMLARRQARAAAVPAGVGAGVGSGPVLVANAGAPGEAGRSDDGVPDGGGGSPDRRAKGRKRLGAWLVRFGVPGASILAPLALPTQLTAAFLVGSGVRKEWVVLWQAIAIVLWTGLVAVGALGLVSLLGW